MIRSFSLFLTAALLTTSVSAQMRSGLQGAWRIVEVTTTGPSASTNTNPRPSLYLFTAKHYSLTREDGTTPRTAAESPTSTADELRNILQFSAQAGTYEITGGDLVFRRIAALAVANMAPGNSLTSSFRIQGGTLWITTKFGQGGPISNPTTYKLRRVE